MTEEDYLELCAQKAREDAKRVLERYLRPFDDVKKYFKPYNMTEEEFEKFLWDTSSEPKVDVDEHSNSVFAIREFNFNNAFLSIYGIYTDLDKAIADLTENKDNLEFDEERWAWRDPYTGLFYRIDEYTLR
jgi:hypothetical protein